MNILYDGGKKSLELSLSIPCLIAGQAGSGKTVLLNKIIPVLSQEGKVCVLNPCHPTRYNSLTEATVPVYMWLADEKYRFPYKAKSLLLDFNQASDTADNIREVLARLCNIFRGEKMTLILDTCRADTHEHYSELLRFFLKLQSENVMCIATVQSLADANLEGLDVQAILAGERISRDELSALGKE